MRKILNKLGVAIKITKGTITKYSNAEYKQLNADRELEEAKIVDFDTPFEITLDETHYRFHRIFMDYENEKCIMLIGHNITQIRQTEESKYTQMLIAAITHELRTPLHIMIATLHFLHDKISE